MDAASFRAPRRVCSNWQPVVRTLQPACGKCATAASVIHFIGKRVFGRTLYIFNKSAGKSQCTYANCASLMELKKRFFLGAILLAAMSGAANAFAGDADIQLPSL